MALTDFTPSNGKIYYMTREQYEAAGSPAGDSNSLYFVQESTNINPNIVTMYAGTALVCELYDITGVAYTQDPDTGDVLYDQQYRINGKMYLRHDDAITDDVTGDILRKETYTLLSYNKRDASDTGRFLECGITNNTIVCYGGKPDVSNCVKGFVYVVIADGEKGIYAFDGTNLVPAVTSSFIPDQFTILQDEQTGIVTGVGANVAGKVFNIPAGVTPVTQSNPVTLTAFDGATIFNEYDESTATNVVAGFNSVAFGKENKVVNGYGYAFGYDNRMQGTPTDPIGHEEDTYVHAFIYAFGEGNKHTGQKTLFNKLFGKSNTIQATTGLYNSVSGLNNNLTGNTWNYNIVHGKDFNKTGGGTAFENNIFIGDTLSTGGQTFSRNIMFGKSHSMSGTTFTDNIVLGDTNSISGGTLTSNLFFGGNNSMSAGSCTYNVVIGSYNQIRPNSVTDTLMIGHSNKLYSPSAANTPSSYVNGRSIICGDLCGNSGVSYSIICGESNEYYQYPQPNPVPYPCVTHSAIFGFSNTYVANVANSLIAGTHNTVNNGISGVFIMGQNNKAALSTDTGQGSTNSGVIGYANTIRYLENCFVVGDSNETSYSQSSLIVGYANGHYNLGPNLSLQKSIVVGQYNTTAGVSYTAIFGYNNYGGSSSCSIISGQDNSISNGHLCASVFGRGLQNSLNTTEALTVIGQYNISGTPISSDVPEYDDIYRKATFIVGNGNEVGNVITRSTSAILTYDGKLHLPSDGGNVITNNGNSIDSIRTSQNTIQTDNGVAEFTYLPKNGQEIIISTEHTVSSVQIDNISTMYYNRGFGVETKAVSSDYNSVIILKKGSIATAEDIMKNFTGADNTPMIYLLNKDIDISTFTILHVMLFNDGFNICAIVSGYEEVSNP